MSNLIVENMHSIMNMNAVNQSVNLSRMESDLINGSNSNTNRADPNSFSSIMEKIESNTGELDNLLNSSSQSNSQSQSQSQSNSQSNSNSNSQSNYDEREKNKYDGNRSSESRMDYSSQSSGNDGGYDYSNKVSSRGDSGGDLFSRNSDQEAHDRMKSAMSEFGVTGVNYAFDKERQEDMRSTMIEEIDCLREELLQFGQNLDGIPHVGSTTPAIEIESCLRLLKKKSDRIKYCEYAESFIMMAAHGIEELFDGKNTWLGFKPNMRGWSKNVENKLRRMKHDTSKLVGQVMHDYNIGPGTRLLLELVPNAVLYSIQKTKNAEIDASNGGDASADTLNRMRDIRF